MQYVITDGKYYVMENPMKPGEFIQTTMVSGAKQFSYKQAKNILNSRSKKMTWIKNGYSMIGRDGEEPALSPKKKGNGGVFIGENDISFNPEILERIKNETEKYLNLSGWNISELNEMSDLLNMQLSRLDSEESDIEHALQIYSNKHNGKRPQAHRASKIAYMLSDIRNNRNEVKICMRRVQAMKNAITNTYSIQKLQNELKKADSGEYKGRTEKFAEAMKILEE